MRVSVLSVLFSVLLLCAPLAAYSGSHAVNPTQDPTRDDAPDDGGDSDDDGNSRSAYGRLSNLDKVRFAAYMAELADLMDSGYITNEKRESKLRQIDEKYADLLEKVDQLRGKTPKTATASSTAAPITKIASDVQKAAMLN